jgi:hypothetical protein
MALPAQIFSRGSYARRFAAAVTVALQQAAAQQQDAERDDEMRAINAIIRFVSLFTNPDGTLKPAAIPTAQSLRWLSQQTATAGQTVFTVPSYTGTDAIAVFSNGALVPPSSVTAPGGTTVTLPAQTLNAVVVIYAYAVSGGPTPIDAADVDVADTGGFFTGNTAEAVLAEIGNILTDPSTLSTLLALSTYLKADGTVALTGNLNAATHRVTNLAAPLNPNDAARLVDVDPATIFAAISGTIAGAYLALAGGTVTGVLTANQLALGGNADAVSHKITNLAAATNPADAVRFDQLPVVPPAAGFNRAAFGAPGPFSWVVPAGVTKVKIRAWGAGAGGEPGSYPAESTWRGGGAGGFQEAVLPVVAGQTVSGVVGAGGAATIDGGNTTVQYSGDGTFAAVAGGGKSPANLGIGGLPTLTAGTSTAGLAIQGGSGHLAVSGTASGITIMVGGDGGDAPQGGSGGRGGAVDGGPAITAATSGIAPGGGGAVGHGAGTSGANGLVEVLY